MKQIVIKSWIFDQVEGLHIWFHRFFADEKFLREMLESSKFFENNQEVNVCCSRNLIGHNLILYQHSRLNAKSLIATTPFPRLTLYEFGNYYIWEVKQFCNRLDILVGYRIRMYLVLFTEEGQPKLFVLVCHLVHSKEVLSKVKGQNIAFMSRRVQSNTNPQNLPGLHNKKKNNLMICASTGFLPNIFPTLKVDFFGSNFACLKFMCSLIDNTVCTVEL